MVDEGNEAFAEHGIDGERHAFLRGEAEADRRLWVERVREVVQFERLGNLQICFLSESIVAADQ